jgi:hypothetical protein
LRQNFFPGVRYLRQSRRLERFEPLKAVGLVTPVLNADLRGQKPTLAEQICHRRFSAFQNTELSNSLSLPAEPKDLPADYSRRRAAGDRLVASGAARRCILGMVCGEWLQLSDTVALSAIPVHASFRCVGDPCRFEDGCFFCGSRDCGFRPWAGLMTCQAIRCGKAGVIRRKRF